MSNKPEITLKVDVCRGPRDGDHVHVNVTCLPEGCADALAKVLHQCCVEGMVAFFGPGTQARTEARHEPAAPLDRSKLQ